MKTEPAATEPTLYRKYRPQAFNEVLGQGHVIRVLSRALETGKLAHAYLFAGPRGTGKTTVARLLAKRLNCERPKGTEPCGSCRSCAAVARGAHLDLIEIDAASNRGIDDIRALKERIVLQPAHGHWKVYIVDEVHMLSKDAFNALLKTLEEPPRHAIFILATTELEKVPETIRSRCQTFVFRRAPVPLLIARLEGIAQAEGLDIAPDALRSVAGMAGGCFRDAESVLSMLTGLAENRLSAEEVNAILGLTPLPTVQEFTDRIFRRDAEGALAIIRAVSEGGYSLAEFTVLLARYLRALATWAAASVHAEAFSPDEEARFREQAAAQPLAELTALVRAALRAKYELRDALYDELPLELLVLEWCGGTADKEQETGNTERARARVSARASTGAARSSENAATPDPDTPPPTSGPQLLLERWPAVLRAASALHPLLLPMLSSAVPLAVRDGSLFVMSDHALAHERFSDTVFRQKLEACLDEVFGEKLRLRLVRERELTTLNLTSPAPDVLTQFRVAAARVRPVAEPALAETLDILGGEVVDGNPATL